MLRKEFLENPKTIVAINCHDVRKLWYIPSKFTDVKLNF